MGFVNQRGFLVDEAERKRYNDLYVQANGGKGGLGSANWTIDREREMLLVCLYREREDMYEGDFHISGWVFYWHGEWVHFLQHNYGKKLADSYFKVTREIKEITMPISVKKDTETFFNDLKEAFEEYRISGALSDNPNLHVDLTLDMSEVL
jgi:hypothetical protein